jgi:rubrerythrin
VKIDSKLKSHEVLAVAIKSEIEAANVYSRLHKRVRNELLKQKLKFLIFEEKKHQQILERLFSQRFRENELKIPEKSFLPQAKIFLNDKSSVFDIFKAALRAEKMSEDFYRKAKERAKDKVSRKILEYLSRVERSHYFMIKSEIDLLEKFPDYYDVEDFHLGQEMVHLGP